MLIVDECAIEPSYRLEIENGNASAVTVLKTILPVMVILTATTALAGQPLYTFDEAFQRGIVSMKSDGSEERTSAVISLELDPGIVSGFAFFFGGQTRQQLDHVTSVAARIREQLPKAILVGGFSESVSNDYSQDLRCGAAPAQHHFDVDKLTSRHQQVKLDVWIDPAKPGFVEYYDCIAKTYIDDGITAFLFEAPSLMIPASSNPSAARKAFAKVAENVRAYAAERGQKVYFFGEAALNPYMHVDAVYLPARYYHTTTAQKYQNRIVRAGVGVGYSYALSPVIVQDTVSRLPPDTKAIFVAIDHWDSKQDDLRRLMELDAENRRYLIAESAKTARHYGALFMPALNACGGCNTPDIVVDPCEKITRGSSVITEYDAVRCEDWQSFTMPCIFVDAAYWRYRHRPARQAVRLSPPNRKNISKDEPVAATGHDVLAATPVLPTPSRPRPRQTARRVPPAKSES